jgi:hypothetical protein
MNGRIDTERILDAFLAPEHDRLTDRVLEASLADIARTPQRRALRVPWRFSPMITTFRAAAGIAAVAIVAIGVIAFNLRPSGVGGGPTPIPTQSPPTASTEATATAAPPSASAWATYTSSIYPRMVVAYPGDWSVGTQATRAFEAGDLYPPEGASYAEAFVSPGEGDAQVAFLVWEMPVDAPPDSFALLKPWAQTFCTDVLALSTCNTFTDQAVAMCHLLNDGCDSGDGAILVPSADAQFAFFRTWQYELFDSSTIRVVVVARDDAFPATARYGGSVALLKEIVAQMSVWTPGQEPAQ